MILAESDNQSLACFVEGGGREEIPIREHRQVLFIRVFETTWGTLTFICLWDSMSWIPRVLKELADAVSKLLSIILEKSRLSGEVLSDWKKRNLTNIFKKGRIEDPENLLALEYMSASPLCQGDVKVCVKAYWRWRWFETAGLTGDWMDKKQSHKEGLVEVSGWKIVHKWTVCACSQESTSYPGLCEKKIEGADSLPLLCFHEAHLKYWIQLNARETRTS